MYVPVINSENLFSTVRYPLAVNFVTLNTQSDVILNGLKCNYPWNKQFPSGDKALMNDSPIDLLFYRSNHNFTEYVHFQQWQFASFKVRDRMLPAGRSLTISTILSCGHPSGFPAGVGLIYTFFNFWRCGCHSFSATELDLPEKLPMGLML
jgi:hypothetical protein